MRPVSIVRFDWTYLASIALWLANMAAGWPLMLRQLEARPQFSGNPQMLEMGRTLLMGGIVVIFVFWLLLWYFTARRASVVSKWIVVVFTVLGALRLPLIAIGAPVAGWASTTLSISSFVLGAFATWMLFRPDARAWFAGGATDSAAKPFE